MDCALLCHLRHPGFQRKSYSGGLPCGALGRCVIADRERGRGPFGLPAGPAKSSEEGLSLVDCGRVPRDRLESPPKTPERGSRAGRKSSGPHFPSTPHMRRSVVANSSPDSVLEAFRRKSGGRSPAPLASPPGATPAARSCGSSRTEQDCYRNDARNNSRVKLTCLATV